MAEKKMEGVNVRPTGQKKTERDYDASDMAVLFRRGDWHDWEAMIIWLDTNGERDNELTSGESIAMSEDLRKLKAKNTPFTRDSNKAYNLAHEQRGSHEHAASHGHHTHSTSQERRSQGEQQQRH